MDRLIVRSRVFAFYFYVTEFFKFQLLFVGTVPFLYLIKAGTPSVHAGITAFTKRRYFIGKYLRAGNVFSFRRFPVQHNTQISLRTV